jgi:hypothetical protein
MVVQQHAVHLINCSREHIGSYILHVIASIYKLAQSCLLGATYSALSGCGRFPIQRFQFLLAFLGQKVSNGHQVGAEVAHDAPFH